MALPIEPESASESPVFGTVLYCYQVYEIRHPLGDTALDAWYRTGELYIRTGGSQ